MPTYRAEAVKTTRYDLVFKAVDDDDAQALVNNVQFIDDLVAEAVEHDDGTVVDPPTRIDDNDDEEE